MGEDDQAKVEREPDEAPTPVSWPSTELDDAAIASYIAQLQQNTKQRAPGKPRGPIPGVRAVYLFTLRYGASPRKIHREATGKSLGPRRKSLSQNSAPLRTRRTAHAIVNSAAFTATALLIRSPRKSASVVTTEIPLPKLEISVNT